MIIVKYHGRLCNNIIQYLAASVFAEKFDMKLNFNNSFIPLIKHIEGYNKYESNPLIVNENNFMTLLNSPNVEERLYLFDGYFQLKEFFKEYEADIRKRLMSPEVREKNQFVVHYRMGDVESFGGDCPFEYYENALEIMKQRGLEEGYLISDSPNHPKIQKLLSKYTDLKLFHSSPMDDLIFAMSFDNIILSKGTYSFLIGYNSKANFVYYEDVVWNWTPKIFLEEEWIKVKF